MSGAGGAAVVAESSSALRERLDACTRYAAVVHEQLAALDRNDLDAFAVLARERETLARRIEGAAMAGVDVAPRDGEREVGALHEVLQRCAEADARLLQRLRALRDEARDALRHLEARRSGVRAYMAAGGGPVSLDVRS